MATTEPRQFSPAALARLKRVVIGLGVAFLATFLLFIVLLLTGGPRAQREAGREAGGTAPWTRALDLPAGTEIAAMVAAGDSVVLHLRGTGGERLLVVEPRSGRMVGTLTLGR